MIWPLTTAGSVMRGSDFAGVLVGGLPKRSRKRSASGLAAFAAGWENSGSWSTQKTSGFDRPDGVPSRISRSPGFGVRGQGDAERDRFGDGGIALAIGWILENFLANFGDRFFVCGGPDVGGVGPTPRGGFPVLQLLELVPQVVELPLRHRLVEIHHAGLNPVAGNECIGDTVQRLPAEGRLKGCALLAAGGIDVTDARCGGLRWRRPRRAIRVIARSADSHVRELRSDRSRGPGCPRSGGRFMSQSALT